MTDEVQAVQAGALWMDEHYPGWTKEIDLSTFEMDMPCMCVLGQVNGHYNQACLRLGWDDTGETVKALGFFVNRDEDDIELADWERLQRAWVVEIKKRREEGARAMEIGKQQPARIVEPIETPVPVRQPKKEPKTAPAPTPTPERVPEKQPVKT